MPRDRQQPTILRETHGPLEGKLSNDLRKVLKGLSLKSYKIKTDAALGVPDVYVVGGNWIESKIERRMPGVRNSPLSLFTGQQRRQLDSLSECGDTTWAAVLWTFDRLDKRIAIAPWWYFRRIRLWPIKTVYHFTDTYVTAQSIDLFLYRNVIVKGRLSIKPFVDRFNAWPDRNDPSYFTDKYQDGYGAIEMGEVGRNEL